MRLKGSITIFISLLLVVVMIFISVICESIRIRGAKICATCALDEAIESSIARYDVELMNNFGIFGSYFEDREACIDFISTSINKSLYPEQEYYALENSDFYNLKMRNLEFNKYQLMTDNSGQAFFEQAVLYSKNNLSAGLIELLVDYAKGNENPESLETYFAELEKQNEVKINDELTAYEKESTESENTNTPDLSESPIESVKELKKSGVLALTVPSNRSVSSATVDMSECVSERQLATGIGGTSESSDIVDKAFYISYLCDKLPCFTDAENNQSYLNYKLEYCLAGKSSDEENLKYVVKQLLLIKEATNLAYLLTDASKVAQARSLALLLVGVTANPQLIASVEYGILLAWAYAESVMDVRNLLNGGTSALLKTADNWKLELDNIGNVGKMLGEPVNEKYGFSYSSYISFLMMFADKDKLVYRGLDMVEQELKSIYDNDSYCMDKLLVYIEAESEYSSSSLFANFNFMNRYTYNTDFTVVSKFSYI